MGAPHSWIGDMLQKFQLHEDGIDSARFDRFRLMIDHARLLDRTATTCSAINAQTNEGLMYQENFTYPHPVICRFVFQKDSVDYAMEVAILLEGPGVVFSSKHSRTWVRRIQRFCGYYLEEKSNIACRMLINPATITETEIQEWFTYLLSGLHYSFKPRQKTPFSTKGWLSTEGSAPQL